MKCTITSCNLVQIDLDAPINCKYFYAHSYSSVHDILLRSVSISSKLAKWRVTDMLKLQRHKCVDPTDNFTKLIKKLMRSVYFFLFNFNINI